MILFDRFVSDCKQRTGKSETVRKAVVVVSPFNLRVVEAIQTRNATRLIFSSWYGYYFGGQMFIFSETAFLWYMASAFFVSLFICVFVVVWAKVHLNQSYMLGDTSATQALHSRPTPRIGGVAIVVGFFIGSLFAWQYLSAEFASVMAAGLVVFLIGLREDLLRDMSPKVRFIAAFASAAVAVSLSQVVVSGMGLGDFDAIIAILPIGVAVTLFWSAGMCHSLNLMDGLNGLASGFGMIVSASLFAVASFVDDVEIQIASGILFASLLGFIVLNWPLGRIFMGDAGAYGVGHILAWLSILLTVRHPSVAGIALILIVFWPVADTTFAILRRKYRNVAADQPDRLHFHHLVVRGLRLLTSNRFSLGSLNSLATLLLLPFAGMPAVFGVILWKDGAYAVAAIAICALLFFVTYAVSMNYFRSIGNNWRLRLKSGKQFRQRSIKL